MTEPFDLDSRIWRYMAFDKFVDLLFTAELYLARADQFQDTWEMYPPAGLLNAENWRALIADNPYAQEVDQDQLIENTMASLEAAYYNKSEYTFSCWSRADREHAGLWDLFTDQQNAVAITSTPRKLITSLRCGYMQGQMLAVGGVSYVDFEATSLPVPTEQIFRSNPVGYWEAFPHGGGRIYHRFEPELVPKNTALVLPYFYKRDSYEYESEVRLVSYAPKSDALRPVQRIAVDLHDLVNEIVVAPKSNQSFYDSVERVAAEKLHGVAVMRSRLHFDRPQSERCRRFIEAKNFFEKVIKERDAAGGPLYILFDSNAEFIEWNAQATQLIGNPAFGLWGNSGGIYFDGIVSKNWATAEEHPNPDDARVVAIATKSLSFGRPLLTHAECESLGFFPPSPPLPHNPS